MLLDEFNTSKRSDARDRIYVMLTLLGGDATLMIDYNITSAQLHTSLLDTWIDGEQSVNESSYLRKIASVGNVLRYALEIGHREAFEAVVHQPKQVDMWSAVVKLHAVCSGIQPSQHSLLQPWQRLIVSLCECDLCEQAGLPTDKALFLFSVGQAQVTKGVGPFLVLLEGEDAFHACAEGVMGVSIFVHSCAVSLLYSSYGNSVYRYSDAGIRHEGAHPKQWCTFRG